MSIPSGAEARGCSLTCVRAQASTLQKTCSSKFFLTNCYGFLSYALREDRGSEKCPEQISSHPRALKSRLSLYNCARSPIVSFALLICSFYAILPLLRVGMGWPKSFLIIAAGCLVAVLAAIVVRSQAPSQTGSSQYVSSGVFTTAHPDAGTAFRDWLDIHPEHPEQPIAYTHKVHLANGLQCTTCHVGVDQGPEARIPNVQFCMTCH